MDRSRPILCACLWLVLVTIGGADRESGKEAVPKCSYSSSREAREILNDVCL